MGICNRCGHVIGARCSECGREMLCGRIGVPCSNEGCLEKHLLDADNDLSGGPIEDPRKVDN